MRYFGVPRSGLRHLSLFFLVCRQWLFQRDTERRVPRNFRVTKVAVAEGADGAVDSEDDPGGVFLLLVMMRVESTRVHMMEEIMTLCLKLLFMVLLLARRAMMSKTLLFPVVLLRDFLALPRIAPPYVRRKSTLTGLQTF